MADVGKIVYDDVEENKISDPADALTTWVMDHVESWIEWRDTNYKDTWEEYYRLWRGIHSNADKTRQSERSKLISPALSQAIEVAVSEQEEAVFGRGRWFDIDDDVLDPDQEDVLQFRNLLMEDLDESGIRASLSEIFLNGAIYGTGIGKIVVEEKEQRQLQRGVYGPESTVSPKFTVKVLPVHPREFAIDPLARSIQEALGMAHDMIVPKHTIVSKQRSGVYRDKHLGSFSDDRMILDDIESKYTKDDDKCRIVEYHGLVPANLLTQANIVVDEDEEELADLGVDEDIDVEDDEMVEAIVTIANDNILLRAVENKYLMKDRCFMAYQHDTVPNRFWGRGISEKGYHPQKALDAELRGRIDAMSLAIHPMVAVDATRMPRGESFTVRPGKTVLTQGDPRTVLMPFNFGQVGTATFPQSGELERMIQMGTGSMDSATPVGVSPRNQTASGMSMIASGSIKRSKRTMANIEKNLVEPLVHKAAWRYIQFDPDRYGIMDIKFKAYSTLGIMARELEQQNIANLMKTVPADSPAYWMLIRSFYDNSSINEKDAMLQMIDQKLKEVSNPQEDPRQEMAVQLELQNKDLTNKKIESEIARNIADAQSKINPQQTPDNSIALSQLEAQLKVMLNEMDNRTKETIAKMEVDKDLKIELMRLDEQGEAVEESSTEDNRQAVMIQPDDDSRERMDNIESSVNSITENLAKQDENRQRINKEIFKQLDKRGVKLTELITLFNDYEKIS